MKHKINENLVYILLILSIIFFIFTILNLYENQKLNIYRIETIKNQINLNIEKLNIVKLEYEKQIKNLENKKNIFDSNIREKLKLTMSESEFKKNILEISKVSNVSLLSITNKKIIKKYNDLSLFYYDISLKSSLNSFGKFLYLLNKNEKYIDSTNIYFLIDSNKIEMKLGHYDKI